MVRWTDCDVREPSPIPVGRFAGLPAGGLREPAVRQNRVQGRMSPNRWIRTSANRDERDSIELVAGLDCPASLLELLFLRQIRRGIFLAENQGDQPEARQERSRRMLESCEASIARATESGGNDPNMILSLVSAGGREGSFEQENSSGGYPGLATDDFAEYPDSRTAPNGSDADVGSHRDIPRVGRASGSRPIRIRWARVAGRRVAGRLPERCPNRPLHRLSASAK